MDILAKLRYARLLVKEGGLYYHYKNPQKYYRVARLAVNEADLTILVVYTEYNDISQGLTWVRPLESWIEHIDEKQLRFNPIE